MSFPAYDQLQPASSLSALKNLLTAQRQELTDRLASQPQTFEALVPPLDVMSAKLQAVWGPMSHLFGVWNTPEWRAAYNEGLPLVTEFGVEMSQSEDLCAAYRRIQSQPLSNVRQKVVTDALREFKLSGIGLPEADKARYKAVSLRLSELQSQFEQRVMDCVQGWSYLVTDDSQLAGMTEAAQQAAAQKADSKGLQGWLLTLDFPSFDAVISHADNRALREKVYQAYATRASDQYGLGGHEADHDNSAVMQEILSLRQELAAILGFASYAEVSLASKMADSPAQVEAFLLELAAKARPYAQKELAALQALAAQDGIQDFAPWDASYYSEKLREQTLGLSDELLRPYFPATQVLDGLLRHIETLFGVRIQPLAGVPVWCEGVETYEILNPDGQRMAAFYLDLYARPDTKRGGAWMDECSIRSPKDIPVAYLVGNFTPPLAGELMESALLTHDEILTLFHEFGHGLHHMLTNVLEPSVAGIRGVEWDAVELPSQFMENWAYQPDVLKSLGKHHQTGEVLPDHFIEQLQKDRQFQSGLATLRQVEFALFDIRLHQAPNPDILAVLQQVRAEVSVLSPPAYNRMAWSFSHIFAGGYAAGYYSYKWAEVLSSDAFAAFEESQFSAQTGKDFLEKVLSQGGSKPAAQLYQDFRGREPSVDALLRHSGLAA
jgi:oligopeptidase A